MAHPTPDTLALVALGEDVEPAALEHIGGCDACFAEVGSLQQVVSVARSLGPDDQLLTPHPRVWDRISSDINDGRVIPLPGAVTLRGPAPVVPPDEAEPVALGGVGGRPSDPSASPPPSPTRQRRWAAVAVAAAVALLFGAGGFVLRGLVNTEPDVVSTTQLNALPRFAGANGTASVEKDSSGQRTLVITVQLPPDLHPDGTMEVWMSDSRATDMLTMGTMNGLNARFPIPASVDLAKNPIVDVSLEPPNDTDPAHSDTSVLRGRLQL